MRTSEVLDFKSPLAWKAGKKSGDKVDYFELAKDVAAFANALGGKLLVGAHGGTLLRRVELIDVEHVKWIAAQYELAIRDRCSNKPFVVFDPLPVEGGLVLAIHVKPSILPIAVKVRGLESDGWDKDAWVYFSRVVSQNVPTSPEQVMMMLPEVRRLSILLRSIPQDAAIVLVHRSADGDAQLALDGFRLAAVVEEENRVTFAKGKVVMRHAALDRVQTVLRGAAGIWRVQLDLTE